MLKTVAGNVTARSYQLTNLVSKYFGIRTLYTSEALGIEGYNTAREKTKLQFTTPAMVEKFRARMTEFVNNENQNLIFTDDLKSMVYLAEANPADTELLHKMLRRFHAQSKGVRFGTFVFGPVLMRFFYSINNPKEALAVVRDPELEGFFDQMMSFQILMDLLLKNKMYDEVVDTFNLLQQRQIQGNRFPKNCVILVLAALYEQNTPESLQKMLKIMADAKEHAHVPMRRSLTFAAGLAVNQQRPDIALEILSSCKQQNYVTVRNLKARALAEAGRLEDSIAVLRSSLSNDLPDDKKRSFNKDVLDVIRSKVNSCDNKEVQLEFARVEKGLVDGGFVDSSTLSTLLNLPIESVQPQDRDTWNTRNNRDRSMINASFNAGDRGSYQRNNRFPPRRPGLRDME